MPYVLLYPNTALSLVSVSLYILSAYVGPFYQTSHNAFNIRIALLFTDQVRDKTIGLSQAGVPRVGKD